MSHSQAYTQAEVDSLIAVIGRHAQAASNIELALEEIVKDHSITAAGRARARQALADARSIAAGEKVLPFTVRGSRDVP